MYRVLIGILLLAPASLYAAKIYKWTDANGTVVFSDQPHANAEEIEIRSVITQPAPAPATAPDANGQKNPAQTLYKSVVIMAPQQDEVIRSNDGTVTIVIQTDPPMAAQKGHAINLSLDGKNVVENVAATSIKLTNVDRGTHQVQAAVVNANGAVLAKSTPVSFHVRRFSKLFSR